MLLVLEQTSALKLLSAHVQQCTKGAYDQVLPVVKALLHAFTQAEVPLAKRRAQHIFLLLHTAAQELRPGDEPCISGDW